MAVEYIGEEMDALNPEVLGDEAAVGVEEGEEQVEGELFPLGLLSTVLTVTVVPAGMFLVRVSALLAASDKLFVLKLFL